MSDKKFIFVCCGAGGLTSFMAQDGIEQQLKERNIKNFRIDHGMISDVPRYEDRIDILVCSTNYQSKHDFPVLNGIPFVIGDEDGQKKLIEELVTLLNN